MEIKDRVLVIEDDKSIRNFMKTILEANNYEVIMAVNGAEAYSMITSQCPDVVILDLGLPDMDGMKILKSVREWSGMPILVVSARSHERDKVEALDLGAGEGDTIRILKSLGMDAHGVDLFPRGSDVETGDFLHLQYPSDSIDLCISQCAFFVSRDQKNALSECWRVLKKGGFLLLSDLDTGNLSEMAEQTGFTILRQEDQTLLWREYYLEAIWNDSFCCEEYKILQKEYKGKKLRYTMVVGRKE